MLQGIQYLFADTLTGANYQAWRTAINALGAGAYLALVAIFATLYGVTGLIIALYAYQCGMIAIYLIVIYALTPPEAVPSAQQKRL